MMSVLVRSLVTGLRKIAKSLVREEIVAWGWQLRIFERRLILPEKVDAVRFTTNILLLPLFNNDG